ncbi:MAG: UDP-3-O-(3-hydroxymyristoyl)glucosamine N-acyltransferase [Gemmatimonadales bacterium]|nr:MAG: UDP-3-O-(3-hydroxymyristoyl)glucosamine N-acyltransferase [Gemmatimonadales bacterium]
MSSFPLRSRAPRSRTLGQLAGEIGADVPTLGSSIEIRGMAPLDRAGEGDLGLLSSASYVHMASESMASALLVSRSLVAEAGDALAAGPGRTPRPVLVVDDAHVAMRRILELLFPELPPEPGIHPTAVVHPTAMLGNQVQVGPYAVIEEDVRIGNRTRIGAHVVVGAGAELGDAVTLLPQVVIYPGVRIGNHVTLHSGVRVGVDGFGYVYEEGSHRHIPHVGGCRIEDDVEIGANCCIDRGSIGDSRIGAGARLDNLVHLGHNTVVGAGTMLAAQVGSAGSARIGRGVVAGGQVGIGGHLVVGDGARLAGQAGIISDVSAGETVMGFPARPRMEFLRSAAATQKVPGLLREMRSLRARVEELESDRGVEGSK